MSSFVFQEGNLFVTKDGAIALPSFFLLIGAPIFLSGRLLIGGLLLVIGMGLLLRSAMDRIIEEDRQEIRYNILSAEDIVAELEALEGLDEGGENRNDDDDKPRIQVIAGLAALAKKTAKENRPESLPLLCQQAAYMALGMYPEDDEVVCGAISLLALVARDTAVRERIKYQADDYGLDVPIGAMRRALERAQQQEEELQEEHLAEIQRKSCLLLGALADGDKELELPLKIVEEDGLQAILDAANWFRFHEEVLNWALWAIFCICYDHLKNKVQLVRLGGILTVCRSLKNAPEGLEVNRHGIAILFDLLRENQDPAEGVKFDPWEVRRLALASGLHDVVVNAMTEFSDSLDIMMMGQEMLLGTGYRGDIPQYQQI